MSLGAQLAALLNDNGLKLAVAESCTGGMVSSQIVDIPGSSRYFIAGVVTYSNGSKVRLLGVNERTLEKYGAVSEETAMEMASGVVRATDADIGLAITGIAGPGGATPQKPVGLVYFAIDGMFKFSEHCYFTGDRTKIRNDSSEHAINLLYSVILSNTGLK